MAPYSQLGDDFTGKNKDDTTNHLIAPKDDS